MDPDRRGSGNWIDNGALGAALLFASDHPSRHGRESAPESGQFFCSPWAPLATPKIHRAFVEVVGTAASVFRFESMAFAISRQGCADTGWLMATLLVPLAANPAWWSARAANRSARPPRVWTIGCRPSNRSEASLS